MTCDEIFSRFQNGFTVEGVFLRPVAYFEWVDEPLYGCEDRAEGSVYGTLRGYTAAGPFRLPIEEQDLNRCELDDDTWLAWQDCPDGRRLILWQNKKARLTPAVQGPWLRAFGL